MTSDITDDLREVTEKLTEQLRIQRIKCHAAEDRAERAERENHELRNAIDAYNID